MKIDVNQHRTFLDTMRAVAWSFIGLRRRDDFEQDDNGGLNPIYVIIAGIVATAIFIGVLLTTVFFVVGK